MVRGPGDGVRLAAGGWEGRRGAGRAALGPCGANATDVHTTMTTTALLCFSTVSVLCYVPGGAANAANSYNMSGVLLKAVMIAGAAPMLVSDVLVRCAGPDAVLWAAGVRGREGGRVDAVARGRHDRGCLACV